MDYKTLQMGGDIIKPIKYHIGEWKALEHLSKSWRWKDNILDVGCGVGYGVGMMKLLGFDNVVGIDLNPDKIIVGKRLGYKVFEQDLLDHPVRNYYDVIWCSHAFEHMQDATLAIERMKLLTKSNATFFFILPYPNLDPAPAHTASKQIGLTVDDKGKTVIQWFESRGLSLNYFKFSKFREPEIWLELYK